MSKSKKIFIGIAVAFFVLLFYASYDISKRTTFPGSKPQLQERIQNKFSDNDSSTQVKDSIERVKTH
jgi:hypothetical protein